MVEGRKCQQGRHLDAAYNFKCVLMSLNFLRSSSTERVMVSTAFTASLTHIHAAYFCESVTPVL